MKCGMRGWVLGALMVLLAGCGPESNQIDSSVGNVEGKAAADLALPLQKGAAPVMLSSMKGKVVILDFWATWCGPCKDSIPQVERIYKKYHEKGLEVVGISVDQEKTVADIPAAVKALGMTYPVVNYADIPDLQKRYQFDGIPQLYLIDRQGNISKSFSGYDQGNNLDARVEALINEKG